ncbi:MAG: T9SS type A sorting domain-containing protein [Candidatus Azobacteroides sp.]|nr:T9SS type A sorting domain-containing protein [Candidatus Azobacteroides sp.]
MKCLSFIANQSIKLIIAVVFFTLTINAKANPIAIYPPEFFVSELRFDSSGEWVIELSSIYFDIPEAVDSVCISTSSGSVKWLIPVDDEWYPGGQRVFTLRNDSLDSDLVVRQEGDFVQVTTYYNESWWGGSIAHTMTFGDYQGATVRSPKEGEAIVHVPYYTNALVYESWDSGGWCIPQSFHSDLYAIATISESDERKVCAGKVRVTIHNPTNQPFSESTIQLRDERYYMFFDMKQQKDGVYEGNVYACNYNLDKLLPWVSLCTDYHYRRQDYWTIAPVQFEMEKDSVVFLDIYISDHVGIKTVKTEEDHVLKIYPNPIVENSFYYETVLPVKSTNSVIEITGLNGQKVEHYLILENKGNIKLPSNILQGIYTVSLIVNQKNYATVKIVVP